MGQLSLNSSYEVRRGLLHKDLKNAIKRLDSLKETLIYLPITTDVMLKSAELWAESRKHGIPTSREVISQCQC
ncbi:MAG: hypothetical protein ABRQ38_09395 [Candidatus Eremiobacterota bacterium]